VVGGWQPWGAMAAPVLAVACLSLSVFISSQRCPPPLPYTTSNHEFMNRAHCTPATDRSGRVSCMTSVLEIPSTTGLPQAVCSTKLQLLRVQSRASLMCAAAGLCYCAAEDLLAVRHMFSKQLKQLTTSMELAITTIMGSSRQQQQQTQQQQTQHQQHGPEQDMPLYQQQQGSAAGSVWTRSKIPTSPERQVTRSSLVDGIPGGSFLGRSSGLGRQEHVGGTAAAAAAAARENDTDAVDAVGAAAAAAAPTAAARARGPSRLLFGSSSAPGAAAVNNSSSGSGSSGGQQQQSGSLGGWPSPHRSVPGPAVRKSPGSGRGVGASSSSIRGSTESLHSNVWRPAGVASAANGGLSPRAARGTWPGSGGAAAAGVGAKALRSVGGSAGGRALNDTELDSILQLLGSLKGQL